MKASSVEKFKATTHLGRTYPEVSLPVTEHVESELLLLLLPGRRGNEPKEQERKKLRK